MEVPGPVVGVLVVEPAEVLARGLVSFVEEAIPGSSVRVLSEAATVRPGAADVVVCGPSCAAAFIDLALTWPAPDPTVIVVADAGAIDFAAMLLAGMEVAWDFRSPCSTFAAALQAALRGETWVSDSLTPVMASDIGLRLRRGQEAANFGLTAREAEVLRLMARGMSNRDIAEQLFISVNTVKNHVRAVLDKLHAGTRTEAVMVGARSGLIDLDRVRD